MHLFAPDTDREFLALKNRRKLHNDIITKHKLILVEMNDETNYPYYFDGTQYYRHPETNKIYRFTLGPIYEALGNDKFRQINDIDENKLSGCVPSGRCHSWSLLGCPK